MTSDAILVPHGTSSRPTTLPAHAQWRSHRAQTSFARRDSGADSTGSGGVNGYGVAGQEPFRDLHRSAIFARLDPGTDTLRGNAIHPSSARGSIRELVLLARLCRSARHQGRAELVLREGDGAWVWDTDGNRYIDATASLWYCNVGYGREEIVDAVAGQMRRLPTYSTFGVYTTAPTLTSPSASAMAPIPGAVVFFTSGGSEAIDTAAKLARRYWDVVGRPRSGSS